MRALILAAGAALAIAAERSSDGTWPVTPDAAKKSPMTPARWTEIIRTAAEQAIDECAGAPTIQAVALRAATLAAEWVCEEEAEERRLKEGDEAPHS